MTRESEANGGGVEGNDWNAICTLVLKQLKLSYYIAPRLHVLANAIAFPPTPQNASSTVSHLHRSAIWSAIASGVTLYHPSSSSRHPSSYREKYLYRCAISSWLLHLVRALRGGSKGFGTHICGGARGRRPLMRSGGRAPRRRTFRVLRIKQRSSVSWVEVDALLPQYCRVW